MHNCADRCCWELFRLLSQVLVFTETVAATPCYVMLYQFLLKVRSVYVQSLFLPADTARFSGIAVRNAEPTAFIVYETVK